MFFLNLDVRGQLLLGDLEPVVEGEFEEVVENIGGHVVQADEVLRGLSHARPWQSPEVAAALRQHSEVQLKGIGNVYSFTCKSFILVYTGCFYINIHHLLRGSSPVFDPTYGSRKNTFQSF